MRGIPAGHVLRVGIVAEDARGRAIRELLLAGLRGVASGTQARALGPEDLRVDVLGVCAIRTRGTPYRER